MWISRIFVRRLKYIQSRAEIKRSVLQRARTRRKDVLSSWAPLLSAVDGPQARSAGREAFFYPPVSSPLSYFSFMRRRKKDARAECPLEARPIYRARARSVPKDEMMNVGAKFAARESRSMARRTHR
jgi:hypothetical protein